MYITQLELIYINAKFHRVNVFLIEYH